MKKIVILLSILVVDAGAMAQQKIALKELDLSKVWQEYGTAFVDGNDVRLHAKAIAHIKLDGKAGRFQTQASIQPVVEDGNDPAWMVQPLVDGTKLFFRKKGDEKQLVGISGADGKIGKGSFELILKADGKEIYNSGVIRQGDAPKQVDVPLEKVQMLEIIVDPTSDGVSGDFVLLSAPVL